MQRPALLQAPSQPQVFESILLLPRNVNTATMGWGTDWNMALALRKHHRPLPPRCPPHLYPLCPLR